MTDVDARVEMCTLNPIKAQKEISEISILDPIESEKEEEACELNLADDAPRLARVIATPDLLATEPPFSPKDELRTDLALANLGCLHKRSRVFERKTDGSTTEEASISKKNKGPVEVFSQACDLQRLIKQEEEWLLNQETEVSTSKLLEELKDEYNALLQVEKLDC